jgi:Helix-turn-helix domain
MSIKVMTQVWEFSMASGNDLMVLLAIADNTMDDTGTAYPSISTLSDKARISESTVKRSLKSLIKLGELVIVMSGGTRQIKQADGTVFTQRWANRYRVVKGNRVTKDVLVETGVQFDPGGHGYDPGAGVTATNPTPGSQLRPTNGHKQQSLITKTKTPAREERLPAKRHVRRASREESSSSLFSVAVEEPPEKKDQEPAVNGNGSHLKLVPTDSDDLAEKIAEEFGLTGVQKTKIATHIADSEDGREYVIQCAEIARAEPRVNLGRAFMASFRDGWEKPKTNIKPKSVRAAPRPTETERQASDEERREVKKSLSEWRAHFAAKGSTAPAAEASP